MNGSIQSRPFGSLPTGELIEAWTLRGCNGLVLEVLTLGGIVRQLLAPDREGRFADVVLGFNNLDSYLAGNAYFGAIIGRAAGRITYGCFSLGGRSYELARNNPPNHLHGGVSGFDKKVWRAHPVASPNNEPCLHLTYCSPDAQEGYPGTVDVGVTYTVTNGNAFVIETAGVSDRPTPFNLTHHSYFNLSGEAVGSIADHQLRIDAEEFAEVDNHLTLLGRMKSVEGEANDFRQPRCLCKVIPKLFQNHGDLYLLNRKVQRTGVEPSPAARLVHTASGRVLEVFTTETHLQFYTGVALNGSLVGKSGLPYEQYAGICLECEGYPDGANTPSLGNIILQPGQVKRQTTTYAFSTKSVEEDEARIGVE